MRSERLQSHFILALALGLGLMRFFRLGEWSLWIDEAYALSDSLHDIELQNPLGYLLFRGALGLVPGRPDEFALRLVPAVAGWLAIPAAAWALRPIAGRLPAALAALLIAVSPWQLYWSQTARFYTLAELVSLIGAGLLLRALVRDRVVLLALGLALLGTACLLHPSGVFLLPVLVGGPTLLRLAGVPCPGARGLTGKLLIACGVMGLLASAGWMLETWAKWEEAKGLPSPVHFVLTTGFYLTPPIGAGLLAGIWVAFRRREPLQLLVVIVALGGLLVAMGASMFARVSAQYVFVLFPWIALLVSLPIAGCLGSEAGAADSAPPAAAKPAAALRWGYAALLALPLLATAMLYFTTRQGDRPRWRDAYRYVWNHRDPGDLILGMEAPVGEYYLSPETTYLRGALPTVGWLDTFRSGEPGYWSRQPRGTWFVINLEQLKDWEWERDREGLIELLRTGCTLEAFFPVQVEARDINVWVYRKS